MLYQDKYFAVSVKLNFCQRQTHCIDDQDKFQSVTDTENGFIEIQTSRKQLQRKDSESDSYDKNNMKEKVNDLVRLYEAVQEKLKTASYSEQIQIRRIF